MKRTRLLFAGILLSGIVLSSCGKESSVAEKAPATAVFVKTAEMLDFESALKVWMQSKHESSLSGNVNSAAKNSAEKSAKTLLISLGKTDIANNANQNTDELVRAAMQEYSRKLTEMYNQQKNN
ncbi:MAG: hypothetical protein ACRC3B_20030 [Bacteroidia bacterium]